MYAVYSFPLHNLKCMKIFQLIPIKDEDILRDWFNSLNSDRRKEALDSVSLEGIDIEIGGIIEIEGKNYAFVYVEGGDIKSVDLPINKQHNEIKRQCKDGDIINGEILYRLYKK